MQETQGFNQSSVSFSTPFHCPKVLSWWSQQSDEHIMLTRADAMFPIRLCVNTTCAQKSVWTSASIAAARVICRSLELDQPCSILTSTALTPIASVGLWRVRTKEARGLSVTPAEIWALAGTVISLSVSHRQGKYVLPYIQEENRSKK